MLVSRVLQTCRLPDNVPMFVVGLAFAFAYLMKCICLLLDFLYLLLC